MSVEVRVNLLLVPLQVELVERICSPLKRAGFGIGAEAASAPPVPRADLLIDLCVIFTPVS